MNTVIEMANEISDNLTIDQDNVISLPDYVLDRILPEAISRHDVNAVLNYRELIMREYAIQLRSELGLTSCRRRYSALRYKYLHMKGKLRNRKRR